MVPLAPQDTPQTGDDPLLQDGATEGKESGTQGGADQESSESDTKGSGGSGDAAGSGGGADGDAWSAEPLQAPEPSYPPLARRMGQEGTVLLEIHIAGDGAVSRVSVTESSGHKALDRAAVKAVRRWAFAPPETEQTITLPVSFVLDQ